MARDYHRISALLCWLDSPCVMGYVRSMAAAGKEVNAAIVHK